jgi:hypothetical protein
MSESPFAKYQDAPNKDLTAYSEKIATAAEVKLAKNQIKKIFKGIPEIEHDSGPVNEEDHDNDYIDKEKFAKVKEARKAIEEIIKSLYKTPLRVVGKFDEIFDKLVSQASLGGNENSAGQLVGHGELTREMYVEAMNKILDLLDEDKI